VTDTRASNEAEWRRLSKSHPEPRVRHIAGALVDEPLVYGFFPYASLKNLRVSRNQSYPWDDSGLPYIHSRADDDDIYEARDGEFRPHTVGDLPTVVRVFLELLQRQD
jgi:hypothetical protein